MTERLTESPRPNRSTLSGSPFPPIAEYGFLSDCEVSALIAASGNVEWMCLPRMDSPSIFINAVMHVINADERLSAGAAAPSGLDPHLEAAAPAPSDEAEPAP